MSLEDNAFLTKAQLEQAYGSKLDRKLIISGVTSIQDIVDKTKTALGGTIENGSFIPVYISSATSGLLPDGVSYGFVDIRYENAESCRISYKAPFSRLNYVANKTASGWSAWNHENTMVSGVKGSSETTYRTGDVSISKANIGLGSVANYSQTATPTSGSNLYFTAGGAYTELNKKENTSNKVTSVTSSSTDTQYPSAKAVYTGLNAKQDTITGGASSIVSSNLTASRALVSSSDGKVAVSAVTATELGYIDGVTSNVQTQLNGKQATISGGASSITSANLTTNRALVSGSDGKVAVSAVTSTELGYIDGVTSNVQTQLNGKQATLVSGTNIKTVNGNSLLGSGNITISGGAVSGVKGNAESSYRTGNVNLTPDNLGIKAYVLDLFFPIGTLYYSMDKNFDPNTAWGGTWSKIETGRFIEATSANPGATYDAGLPDISGYFGFEQGSQGHPEVGGVQGAFYKAESGDKLSIPSATGQTTNPRTVFFSASKSNSIYGNSSTVQPKSITAFIWKRTA